MRKVRALAVLVVTAAALAPAAQAQNPTPQNAPRPPGMTLMTTAWADGDDIPLKYTQATPDAAAHPMGVSPAFTWSYVPEGTVSFVLLFRDPDVARERGSEDNLHWLVWNIPGSARGLPEGVPAGEVLPDGTRQTSVSGPSYRGPGANAAGPKHHYTFELFALDTMLDVQPDANPSVTRARILEAMNGHVLGKAVYFGLFKRPAT